MNIRPAGSRLYRNNLVEALSKLDGLEIVGENPDLIHYPFLIFLPDLAPKSFFAHRRYHSRFDPSGVTRLLPLGLRARLALFTQKCAIKHVSAVLTDS